MTKILLLVVLLLTLYWLVPFILTAGMGIGAEYHPCIKRSL